LDKFGRYYAWFLLVATGLPAIVRMAAPRQFAVMTAERISDEKKRKRHRMLGWISLVGSLALIPVYFFYSQQRWLVVAFLIGIITGVEMITNANRPERESLITQNRIFGAAYVVCAIFTYWFVLYRR
jgi:dipeptide/tripeptide permease